MKMFEWKSKKRELKKCRPVNIKQLKIEWTLLVVNVLFGLHSSGDNILIPIVNGYVFLQRFTNYKMKNNVNLIN